MTLRSANDLRGYRIHATDGEIGHAREFLFDDERWTIRYLVVETGGWLSGRQVLISPVTLGATHWDRRVLDVTLTRQQIEQSPDVTTEQPVSRQHERALADYYGYGPYWMGANLWGAGLYPGGLWGAGMLGTPLIGGAPPADEPALSPVAANTAQSGPTADEPVSGDQHLRSSREVTGYAIQALDDGIGHVDDFLIDDSNWLIRYLIIDTNNWWPGKRVLLPPHWITAVSWEDRTVRVDLLKEQIKRGPVYDPQHVLNSDDEANLEHQHGRESRTDTLPM